MIRNKRYPRGGFTLIELLVVVLIIGILAAITLPQYQLAVGKAKFSTIKDITKSIQESAQRYYMIHNTYEGARENLDIEVPSNVNYIIWTDSAQHFVAGIMIISNTSMGFYVDRETGKPARCLVFSINKNDIPNRICQQDTNSDADDADCSDSYCQYFY